MIREQWTTWVFHFLQGALYTFLLALWLGDGCGYVANAAIWTHREGDHLWMHAREGTLEEYRMDSWLDWLSALIGGGLGLAVKWLFV